MSDDEDARTRAILDSYKVVCICNKIRKGVIEKAIRGWGAHAGRRPAAHPRLHRSVRSPTAAAR